MLQFPPKLAGKNPADHTVQELSDLRGTQSQTLPVFDSQLVRGHRTLENIFLKYIFIVF